eukprot:260369_1
MANETTICSLADLYPSSLLPKNENGLCTLNGIHGDGVLLWNESGEYVRTEEPFIFHTLPRSKSSGIYYERQFGAALKAGMQQFPEHLGFLFFVGGGTTPFQLTVNAFGAEIAMKIIKRCIPPSVKYEYPIVHYAIRRAPQLIDLIIQHYPTQLSLKDPETSLYPFLVAASFDYQGGLS